jgi:hypothetical protein
MWCPQLLLGLNPSRWENYIPNLLVLRSGWNFMAVATNHPPTWPQRDVAAATTATLAVVVLVMALVVDRDEVVMAGALKVGHPQVLSANCVAKMTTRSFGATKDSTLPSPGHHRRLLPLQQPPMAWTPTDTWTQAP